MAQLSGKDRKRVLLVDDHALARQALRETLSRERDLAVCGEAEDRAGALAAIAASGPDLAIVDVGMKDSGGIRLIQDIHNLQPRMPTVVLTMLDELLYAERAIRAGASGYISKKEAPAKITQVVRQVLAGEICWGERVAAQVASKVARSLRRANSLPAKLLSKRELQVFELIGSGILSTSAVAAMLHIDVSTLETCRTRMKEKLNLRDARELLRAAIRWSVAQGAYCQ
jgi:DNA-binding NarL/FixJ family response regulator